MKDEQGGLNNRSKKRTSLSMFIVMLVILGTVVPIKLLYHAPAILVNQVGFLPQGDKTFLVKSDFLLGAPVFEIDDEHGEVVLSNVPLEYLGQLWGAYYYRGDFSNVTTPGIYSLRVTGGLFTLNAGNITISPQAFDLALVRGYEFFYYQRSNCQTQELVPGYPGHLLDHMDDGMVVDGVRRDLWGGWFSAGDYNKHINWGDHIEGVLYATLAAYERCPTLFNGIDLYSTNGSLTPDQIPDILDEAMWGAQYLQKCILPNGTIIGSLVGKTLQFVAPELDTDQINRTADDRFIDPTDPVASPSECMWIAAGYAKLALIANQTGYFGSDDSWLLATAEGIYANYSCHYDTSAASWSAPDAAPFLAASADLAKLDPAAAYAQNATWAAIAMANDLNGQNTDSNTLGDTDRALGMVIEWATANGSAPALAMANAIVSHWWSAIWAPDLADPANFYSITRFYANQGNSGEWVYVQNGLGTNSFFLYNLYALALSDNLTGGTIPGMRQLIGGLLDWMYGQNPDGICMEESVGTTNLPAYLSRLMFCRNNPRGAVPGEVPNGYFEKNGVPYVDLSDVGVGSATIQNADFNSNEPWLPHNVALLHALSVLTSVYT